MPVHLVYVIQPFYKKFYVKMWLMLFVHSSHRRFHLLLHRGTSLQIWLHPETCCQHWESKFLARVLKFCKSTNIQEGSWLKDLDLIKPQTENKNTVLLCSGKILFCFWQNKVLNYYILQMSLSTWLFVLLLHANQVCLSNGCRFQLGWTESCKIYQTTFLAPWFVFSKTCCIPIFHHVRAQMHSADDSSGGF